MPLYRRYQEEDLLVGVWKADESIEQLWALLEHPVLYEEEVKKFTSDARKHEWLTVRVLLKTLCGEKDIAYCPSGKPYLKDNSGFISISHTRGYVAVAFHPLCEVGIDIEKYGERVKKVAPRFIRPDEQITMTRGNELYALLLHWSAKETMFKVMGAEQVDFIHHLHILPFFPVEEGFFEACEYRTMQQRHYRIRYMTHSDFVLTWTVKQ